MILFTCEVQNLAKLKYALIAIRIVINYLWGGYCPYWWRENKEAQEAGHSGSCTDGTDVKARWAGCLRLVNFTEYVISQLSFLRKKFYMFTTCLFQLFPIRIFVCFVHCNYPQGLERPCHRGGAQCCVIIAFMDVRLLSFHTDRAPSGSHKPHLDVLSTFLHVKMPVRREAALASSWEAADSLQQSQDFGNIPAYFQWTWLDGCNWIILTVTGSWINFGL